MADEARKVAEEALADWQRGERKEVQESKRARLAAERRAEAAEAKAEAAEAKAEAEQARLTPNPNPNPDPWDSAGNTTTCILATSLRLYPYPLP